ncbi:serine/threonine-protein kinase [Streptomyces sp. NBC_01471]|uniref:serine/threonine-protein kinase n=1 Tax=Streptomyces sp. NBC_01471 TaxID=2903879 RepID=UPI00352E50D2
MEKLRPGDPHHIGAYRVLARLGAGGTGQTYLARSDRGRTVAVKVVREELAGIDGFRDRLRLEVRAARRVPGPWTAPVLDADTGAPAPWVATGYVAGLSLHSVVSGTHGPLPEQSVRILGSGLAHALADIHAAGLVHRGLKPSNVLVTIDGPRVIDFGIARALGTMTDGGPRRTAAPDGSPEFTAPGFMASEFMRPEFVTPEQIRGDRPTPASDVFCLGSVLAYASCGAMPFGTAGSGAHALTFRTAQEPPDLGGLPEGLRDLVAGCLHRDPAARPTLARILERTDEPAADDPWLPGPLVAQLGRHAVKLLEAETPAPPSASPPPYDCCPLPPPRPRPGYRYYTPVPIPEPPDRNSRWTLALVVVALIVAVGAGGSVYAVMNTGTASKGPASHSTPGSRDPAGDGSPAAPATPGASNTSGQSGSPERPDSSSSGSAPSPDATP